MCPSLQRSYFHGCKISDNSKQYFKSTTNELKLLFSLPSVQLQPVLSRSLQCFNFNPHCTYASGVIKAAGRPIREKEGRDSMCVTWWAGSVACITDCCVTRLHSQHCSLFRCLTPPPPPTCRYQLELPSQSWIRLNLLNSQPQTMRMSCYKGSLIKKHIISVNKKTTTAKRTISIYTLLHCSLYDCWLAVRFVGKCPGLYCTLILYFNYVFSVCIGWHQ